MPTTLAPAIVLTTSERILSMIYDLSPEEMVKRRKKRTPEEQRQADAAEELLQNEIEEILLKLGDGRREKEEVETLEKITAWGRGEISREELFAGLL